jgi:hypothetical protein
MAYFRCYQEGVHRTFVIELTSVGKIKEARAIVDDLEKTRSTYAGRS